MKTTTEEVRALLETHQPMQMNGWEWQSFVNDAMELIEKAAARSESARDPVIVGPLWTGDIVGHDLRWPGHRRPVDFDRGRLELKIELNATQHPPTRELFEKLAIPTTVVLLERKTLDALVRRLR